MTPLAPGAEAQNRPARERDPVWLAVVAFLALLGFAWGVQNFDREHDRHVLLGHVREIASLIRTHQQPGLWLRVERDDSAASPDPERERRHQAMLSDFERLAHLDDVEMTDFDVQLARGEARVSYRVRSAVRGASVPAGGELRFVREGDGWQLASHRFTR